MMERVWLEKDHELGVGVGVGARRKKRLEVLFSSA